MSDYSNNVFTTGVINAGIDGYMYGELEFSGDEDWFKILLRKNMSYTINLEGMATNQGSLSDPYLRGIYDSNGYFIDGTKDDDSGFGTNSKVIFSPAHTDYYYISAGAYKSDTGIYKLTITNEVNYSKLDSIDGISFYDAGNTYKYASYFDLKNKSLITGHVDFNSDSYDFYQFYAREDRKISIKLTGLSSDIDLVLSDAYGNKLARSTSSGNSDEYISYEIKAGNTYNVNIETYGSSISDYNLNIETMPSPKVYWSVRDLDNYAFGNHHFLQFENVNKDGYESFNLGNNKHIFTMGATVDNGRMKSYISNNGSDITSILEDIYGTSSLYDYDLESHLLSPPNGMTYENLVNNLLSACEAYKVNEISHPVTYINSGSWFDPYSDTGNCATWVNSILAYVGFSEADRNALGEFNGIDWGEENLLDMRYFENSPFWG